jgi:hypothetical protein
MSFASMMDAAVGTPLRLKPITVLVGVLVGIRVPNGPPPSGG